jgi:hypothetical protein
VDVIAPMIVAALVNGNEAVGVIDKPWTSRIDQLRRPHRDALDHSIPRAQSLASISDSIERWCTSSFWKWSMLEGSADPTRRLLVRSRLVDHPDDVVPVHERGHHHGGDHVHDPFPFTFTSTIRYDPFPFPSTLTTALLSRRMPSCFRLSHAPSTHLALSGMS